MAQSDPESTAGLPLRIDPVGERHCPCVANHTPEPRELHRHHVWPLGKGGPDVRENLRWLCPTSHASAHRLWRAYDAAGGTPPWAVRAPYGRYVRQLVADGWAQAHAED